MKQPVKLLSTCLTLLAVLATDASAGAARHALDALHATVVTFVTAQHPADADIEVIPDRLDPRLRLTACPSPVQAFWAPGSPDAGQTTVGLRCEGARPWKLYLPTRVRLMQPVVVATRPLTRGQRLAAGDLTLETRDVGTLRDGIIVDPARVLGYVVKRSMPAGRALDLNLLQAPRLVERGHKVRIAVAGSGVRITMSGIALEHGALGETVRVRNPASRRVVEGVVAGPARVQIPGPASFRKAVLSQ